jgi:hypothetical protein
MTDSIEATIDVANTDDNSQLDYLLTMQLKSVSNIEESLRREFMNDNICVEDYLNGILNLIFQNPNMSSPLVVRMVYLTIMFTVMKSTAGLTSSKKPCIDAIVNIIYTIDKCTDVNDFNKKLKSLFKSNIVKQYFQMLNFVCIYSRTHFDLHYADKLTFSTPERAVRIASGMSYAWTEFLEEYHPYVMKRLAKYEKANKADINKSS